LTILSNNCRSIPTEPQLEKRNLLFLNDFYKITEVGITIAFNYSMKRQKSLSKLNLNF